MFESMLIAYFPPTKRVLPKMKIMTFFLNQILAKYMTHIGKKYIL